jgi:hypothetical protein
MQNRHTVKGVLYHTVTVSNRRLALRELGTRKALLGPYLYNTEVYLTPLL